MKGLLIYGPDTVKTFIRQAVLADARDHIQNGYPHLLADFDAGVVKAVETDMPDEFVGADCKYDKGGVVPLTPEEIAARDVAVQAEEEAPKRILRTLALIDRETKYFIADRLLTHGTITQAEYDDFITYIGKE